MGKGLDVIDVTAIASDLDARINVNGTEAQSGKPSQEIKLKEGVNRVTIKVTASDGIEQKTYSVVVTKGDNSTAKVDVKAQIDRNNIVTINGKLSYGACEQASVMVTDPNGKINYLNNASLSTDMGFQFTYMMTGKLYGKYTVAVGVQGLTSVAATYFMYKLQSVDLLSLIVDSAALSPSFDPAVTEYDSKVTTETEHVVVVPTAVSPDAAIKVNGADVSNGGVSDPIKLSYGTNRITITITSADGILKKTYTVNVERPVPYVAPSQPSLSTDATLQGLSVSAGTLDPEFEAGTMSYNVSVAESVDTITVTPTAHESHAVIKVNGNLTASGNTSGGIALNYGANTITIEVTAQDGTTKETYIITVTREEDPSANNAILSGLSVYNWDDEDDYIADFNSDVKDYTIDVPSTYSFEHPEPDGGANLEIDPVTKEKNATFGISVSDETCEIQELRDENGTLVGYAGL